MVKPNRWTQLATIISMALLLALSGCDAEPTQSPAPSDTASTDAEQAPSPSMGTSDTDAESASPVPDPAPPAESEAVASATAIDGIVSEGEYAHTRTIADVVLHWSTDNDTLTMAMAAPCTGYVTVGFDPENRKEGGNYIIGYVVDGVAVVRDHVGTRGNLHEADVDLGGEDNLVAYAGFEADGWTTLEFVIPLDSGDDLDKPLVPGNKHIVLVAYQRNRDDLISVHTRHGVAQVEL